MRHFRYILGLLVALQLICCAKAYAGSSAFSSLAQAGESFFNNIVNNYKTDPNLSSQDNSWQKQQQTGSVPNPTYSPIQQGGMVPTATFTIPGHAPAQNALENQQGPVPHPFTQKEYTEPVPPWQPHFGPPRGEPVFRYTPANNNPIYGMDPALFQDAPWLNEASPGSDAVGQSIALRSAALMARQMSEVSYPAAKAQMQGKLQQAEQSSGSAANTSFQSTMGTVTQSLINVANENASSPATGTGPRTLPQAIWMVQQLYHQVFVPMALLLVLPGALLTQSRALVHIGLGGIDEQNEAMNKDSASPFTGIIRSIIAIFMIPATQLIISYSIDIGNAMTNAVQQYIDKGTIQSWQQKQTTGTPPANAYQADQQNMKESVADTMSGSIYNNINMFLNYGITVLIAYQIVMMSYLFLMGPIAAALYAWPSGVGRLFKLVIPNWIDAVTILSLWRFWWCAILLCMSTRIHWLQQIGQYNPADPWEKLVSIAFMVMLAYVPFAPFDFRPGDMVENLLQKAGGKSGQ